MDMKRMVWLVVLSVWWLPVWCQADSVVVRMGKIKAATEDSIRLKYADEVVCFLEGIGYGMYDLGRSVPFLGYKRCVNAEVELFSWVVPLERK
ncbi:MAG: hypothetical protein RSA98_10535, partial [Odoribacter sp.]